jgi:hypothetical protein
MTAQKTETITQARFYCGATAAGATPTLIRLGVYTEAANGDLTFVMGTTNDTTLLTTPNTAYTKGFTSSWNKVAGTRYAVGLLVVTAAAVPTTPSIQLPSIGTDMLLAPKICSARTGQSDLPGSVLNANLGTTGGIPYYVLLP